MYVILVYDVKKERVQRIMKKCRQYLHHVQRSVFEGNLTDAQLARLKKDLSKLISTDTDAVCIYCMGSMRYTTKHQIGLSAPVNSII